MKKVFIIKIIQIILFVLGSVMLECFLFSKLGFGSKPDFISLDICLFVFFSSAVFFFKSPLFSMIYLSLLFTFESVLFFTNLTLFDIYGSVFTTNQLYNIGEGTEVFSFDFISVKNVILTICIIAIFVTINVIILPKEKVKAKYHFVLRGYLFMVILLISGGVFYRNCSEITKDKMTRFQAILNCSDYNYMQYVTVNMKTTAFKSYGYLTFYMKEIEAHNVSSKKVTHNDDYNDLRAFFSKPVVSDNEFTGLLNNYNVLNVMIESGQDYAINEILTPTLYKLKHEGINFTNNYSRNLTNNSEFIGITGSWHNPTIYRNIEYTLPFTVPNMLSNYTSNFYHDNDGDFYSRDYVMPKIGFDNSYFHNDLYPNESMWDWGDANYTPDSKTAEKIIETLDYSKPFYNFWTTLSTHGPYNYNESNIKYYTERGYFSKIDEAYEKNQWDNLMEDKDSYKGKYRYYQAAFMDLDYAMELFIDDLEAHNQLDNTLIILYGDHEAYYDSFAYKLNSIPTTEYYNVELYKTTMIMYNKKLGSAYEAKYKTHDFNEFTSPYIIAPTVLDLLGMPYNDNFYAGQSIFNPKFDHIFYYSDKGGFLTNNLYSDDGQSFIFEKDNVTDKEKENFKNKAILYFLKMNFIDQLYKNNGECNIFGEVDYNTFNYR